MGRILRLLLLVVAASACSGVGPRGPTQTPSRPSPAATPSAEANVEPSGVAVHGSAEPPGPRGGVRGSRRSEGEYDRKTWAHWVDEDRDCQDTRAEVLIRDSEVPVTMDPDGCDVVTGRWTCPYSLQVFEDPSELDIDHVVPLQHAFENGAQEWNAEKRRAYANALDDPQHLAAVWNHSNRSKGARGIEGWLPQRAQQRCEYVARWLAIKRAWNLVVTPSEQAVAARYGRLCAREVELPAPQDIEDLERELVVREDPTWTGDEAARESCCRVCRKGKPCGDSCIARGEVCRRPVGCACGLPAAG